jgi:Rieske Fe-S protein
MAEKSGQALSRRSFIGLIKQFLAFTGLAAITGPIVAYFWPAKLEEYPTEPVAVGPVEDIPVGSAKTIPFGRNPAIIINMPEVGIVAYSAECTHFTCIVHYEPELRQLMCPCHDGYFDAVDGTVISGPPPEPLMSIPWYIEDGIIYLHYGGEA